MVYYNYRKARKPKEREDKTMKKRTVKELRYDVKKDVDAFVIEMIEKYPEILTSATLQNLMEKEIGIAFVEIEDDGRIHSMKERWG